MSKKAVLLIESDRPLREAMADALAVYGYQVETARDAREGVAKIGQSVFDVVVADTKCLGDGKNVLRFSRDAPLIPVICLSGERQASYREAALNAGAAAYLIKPVMAAELHRAIEGVLLQVWAPSSKND